MTEAPRPWQKTPATEPVASAQVKVSFFADAYAKSIESKKTSLESLRDRIARTNASEKKSLPWLKLAQFGETRSANGSLRHDANVLLISGIEVDYDGERIALNEAVRILKSAGLVALAYTSPSHTPDKPRWRILLPTSCDRPPAERTQLVARVNGLFGGQLAAESFTLSQAYFFGSVKSNPAHQTVVLDGEFIDLRGDLDEGAIGYDTPQINGHTTTVSSAPPGYIDAAVEALVAEALPPGRDRSKRFAHAVKTAIERGMSAADFESLCRANPQGCAQKYLPPERRRDELQKWIVKIWQLHAAVVERDAFGAEIVRQLLEGPHRRTTQALKTAITQVGEWVRGFGAAADPLIEDADEGEIIGRAQQGVLYGPMGTGKTAIANEIAVAVATGDGMGIQHLNEQSLYRSQKGRVLFAIYEDPFDFRRRMLALAKVRGVDLDVLNLAIVSADLNITKEKDRAALLERIRADVAVNGPPALLILDTVAAALGAESSNDDDVVGKLFAVSQSLVREYMSSVIFVAHPGKDETRGIAGSYRFAGNSDFILKTVKTSNGFRLVKDKDRNGAKRPLFDYTLSFIEVERTLSGKPRTGAVVGTMQACALGSLNQHVAPTAVVAPAEDIPKRKLSDRFKLALDTLAGLIINVGRPAPATLKLLGGAMVVGIAEWRDELLARAVIESDSKNPRQDFKRIKAGLAARRLIGERDEFVWLV